MKAEVRSFVFLGDGEGFERLPRALPGPQEYVPPDPRRFAAHISIYVGVAGERGEYYFDITVRSPRDEVERQLAPGKFAFGYFSLVTPEWDWPAIERFLRKTIEEIEGDTWDELARKIGRFAQWELNTLGYVPDDYTARLFRGGSCRLTESALTSPRAGGEPL